MPYEYNPEEEDENQGGEAPPPPPPQQGGAPASAAEAGQSPFVNLQKYLQVNQDQTGDLANKVANPIESQAESAKDKATQAKGSFQQQVQEKTVTAPTFLNQLGAGADYSSGGSQGLQFQPAGAAGLTDEQKNEIKQKREASYSGPGSIEETGLLDDAYGEQAQAQERAQLSESNSGRYSLLKDLVGNPNYKTGQTRLDQALLSGSSGAQERLGRAREKVGEVPASIQEKAAEANASVDPARRQTDQTRNTVNQSLNDAVAAYMARLQSDAAEKSRYDGIRNQQVLGALSGGSISKSDARDLGLDDSIYGNTYGVNAGQFYRGADADYSASDVATPYQRSQLAALQELQGRENPYLQDVGSKQSRGFDLAGYKSAIDGARAQKSQDTITGINDIRSSFGKTDKRDIGIMNAAQADQFNRDEYARHGNMPREYVLKVGPDQYIAFAGGNQSQRNAAVSKYQQLMSALNNKYSGAMAVAGEPVAGDGGTYINWQRRPG